MIRTFAMDELFSNENKFPFYTVACDVEKKRN